MPDSMEAMALLEMAKKKTPITAFIGAQMLRNINMVALPPYGDAL